MAISYYDQLLALARTQSNRLHTQFAMVGHVRNNIGLYAIYSTYTERISNARTTSERRALAREMRQQVVSFSQQLYKTALSNSNNYLEAVNAILNKAVQSNVTDIQPTSTSTSTSASGLPTYLQLNEDDLNFWDVYLAFLDGQFDQFALSGYDVTYINLVLNPVSLAVHLTDMLTRTTNAIHQSKAADRTVWYKQVVAAIDTRTTDTCRFANGQLVKWDEKFHLTGEPRYDEYMDWMPFHRWCRSSGVLIPASLLNAGFTLGVRP